MKIRLVVANVDHGYSFIIQAKALEKGLLSIGVDVSMDEKMRFGDADVVIGVGSYIDYEILVNKPKNEGAKKVVPWIVSDDNMENFISEYNDSNILLTPSEFCKSVMVRDGIKEKLIKVLPEAVDSEFWKPIPESEIFPVIELLSIKDGQTNSPIRLDLVKQRALRLPILFTTGGDVSSKGAIEVISALGNIYKRTGNKNWLYLIKTWPSAESMRKSSAELELCNKLGILSNVKYVVGEFSSEFLRAMMNICDIYVAPSRSEGFGLPLVEAAMCMKPVITSEGTAACESVDSGQTGFVVKSDYVGEDLPKAKIDELEKYLEVLLSNEDLRIKMGSKGQKRAIENYAPEVVAKKLLNFL